MFTTNRFQYIVYIINVKRTKSDRCRRTVMLYSTNYIVQTIHILTYWPLKCVVIKHVSEIYFEHYRLNLNVRGEYHAYVACGGKPNTAGVNGMYLMYTRVHKHWSLSTAVR